MQDQPAERPAVPVLLDTDIGSDIDDALALAYLLRQPRCELLGVTTVTGEPERRAVLADALCRAAGRGDVPVHPGAGEPLLVPVRQATAGQAAAVEGGKWPLRTFGRRNSAVAFLQEQIRARPGEVTLLTIGPLTNVGLLFALDPEIPALLKHLVVMGGRYYSRSPEGFIVEWNLLCDPHAAAKVFGAPAPRVTLVGLDVTDRCRMGAVECRARLAAAAGDGGPLSPVLAVAEKWSEGSPAVIFHDPLAAALIFEPGLCGYADCHIGVDLTSAAAPGQSVHLYHTGAAPHRVAVSVRPDAFFSHYFSVVAPG